jgi:N-acetylglucosamine malate deacetylase 1
VVAPHPDDESIGCGGAICLHGERGDRVHVVFLTSGERGIEGVGPQTARAVREAEAAEALAVLGVEDRDYLRLPDLGVAANLTPGARGLAELLAAHPPDLIYLPHPAEAHPDHEAALPLVRSAVRQAFRERRPPELRGYEVWTPMALYGWSEDITRHMGRKLRAVRCYRSQLRSFRYDRAVRGLNQYRGCLAGRCRYAEVFQYVEAESDSPAPTQTLPHPRGEGREGGAKGGEAGP